ncbi:MAG: helix-turn-helix domain-containing protein, partial [Pseudomonadota bacterium]
SRSLCTVARATELVGEPWTLMILREMFLRSRRFDELQKYTGASPHLLSQRLKRMEAEGIVVRRRYQERPPRDEYRLTEKGRDLWPVIIALKTWGDKWRDPDGIDPVVIVHKGCGKVTRPSLVCSECGEPMEAHDASVELDPAFADERDGRLRKHQGKGTP